MNDNSFLNTVWVVSILVVTLTGCAAMDKSDAMDTERVLAAAGFQMQFANTSAQIEQVKKSAAT